MYGPLGMGGGGSGGVGLPVSSSSQSPQPAKAKKAIGHHQHNKGYGGVNPASVKQLVYSATFSFDSCAEQSHKDKSPDNQLLKPEAKDS